MNSQHRTIRAQLSVMCENRAIEYIRAFHLPPDEESYIIDREVYGLSIQEIADKHHSTKETVKRRRRGGFRRIADKLDYEKSVRA